VLPGKFVLTSLWLLLLTTASAETMAVNFTSHDGYPMFGKLTLPDTDKPHSVVVYVQTAEGATIDMKRPKGGGGTFNYYDLYRQKLPEMNVAFFSYEGRGIRMGPAPPRYEQIDRAVYNTSTLENKVLDILSAVKILREQKGIDPARIFLMGASEGTLLAAEAASRAPDQIRGLILYGVLSSTLQDALTYMVAEGNFLNLRPYFDMDKSGSISAEEYEADPRQLRARGMQGVTFAQLDTDGDGSVTQADWKQLRKPVLDGVAAKNIEVVSSFLSATAVVSLPEGWLQDHFAHPPMWTFLEQLDIPIGLFHGGVDANTPIAGVRSLEERSKQAGKSKMEFHYFDDLDHSLGIVAYFLQGVLPAGHQAIFEFIKRLAQE
jgi:pimeloyl-ACP methyl ester carboxylesterase